MPDVQHSYDSEALLREFQRRLNVTGDYIHPKTIFGDLIDFWRTKAGALQALNHEPVVFTAAWLTYADGTHTRLVKLLTRINWQFVGALDTCVARLFKFTMTEEVKKEAWDHLRKYITMEHFKGMSRFGLSLPAAALQSLSGTVEPRTEPYRKDVAEALTALVEGIVKQALTEGPRKGNEALAAVMQEAMKTFAPPVQPAEDNVICIFDVSPQTKAALVQAAGNGKLSGSVISDCVTALILQKLHIEELPGIHGKS
ncbi:MAG: hypothetical protein B7Z37_21100 [Verrucomicrobia bacterium 12-59-8]|nr:MAG: hypothetical protein B7Z37_21100 [Verrucomicrobia bacterium 12-59-8]